jgi:hypothetical protein
MARLDQDLLKCLVVEFKCLVVELSRVAAALLGFFSLVSSVLA